MAGSGLGPARVGAMPDMGVTRPWQGFHRGGLKRRPGLDPGETWVSTVSEQAERAGRPYLPRSFTWPDRLKKSFLNKLLPLVSAYGYFEPVTFAALPAGGKAWVDGMAGISH